MPDDNNHPLYNKPNATENSHPLSDAPPDTPKQRGVSVPLPLKAKRPYLTYILLVLNVAIFILRYITPELATQMIFAGYIDVQSVLQDREFYRLVTGMFLHFDEAHILFNSIALYYVGTQIERLFGHARFALVYILGGLGGSIFPLLFGGGGLGASGAVFALWGAEIVFLYLHLPMLGDAGRSRLQSSLALMVVNFIAGFSANALANVADSAVRVGNAAHFGGLLGGVILGYILGPRFTVKRNPDAIDTETKGLEIVADDAPFDLSQMVLYYVVGLVAILLVIILLRS